VSNSQFMVLSALLWELSYV